MDEALAIGRPTARACLVAGEVHLGHTYVHGGDGQSDFGQMIDHALADGCSILRAAIACGQTQQEKNYPSGSHHLIIPASGAGAGNAVLSRPLHLRTLTPK